jgi:hypothetical protein
MGTRSERRELAPPAATPDCPLTPRQQTRNILLYSTNVGLIYLAAPVVYVGLTQAALCEKLGATRTIANLPSSVYFFLTPLPILVAWYFCAVRALKPVLVGAYLSAAAAGAVVAAALLVPTPAPVARWLTSLNEFLPANFNLTADWVVPAVLVHAGVLGCTLGVVATFQWEVLARGVSESRRGRALALAFGVGPVLAFASSLGSQPLLNRLAYPGNFALLFAVTVPILGLAAFLSTRFVVLYPPVEVARQSFVSGVFGGLGEFLRYRVILVAAIAMVLVTCGYNILPNISLYTQQAVGEAAERYVGYQNGLRFGCKIVAGLFLGWLLTRTNPKAGLLVTGGFCLASVAWVLAMPAEWFLVSFGLMGAGELFGVYYPNYIICCSPKSRMRRNVAFISMLNMPSAVASVLFGVLADRFGLRWSFAASLGLLAATLLLVQFALPRRPRPREIDMDESDRALEPAPLPAAVASTAITTPREGIHPTE